jgi:hypothetical protein
MRRAKFCVLLMTALFLAACPPLYAQVTLLLEEPYSRDGTFAGTGHAAVYLSRVCAATPVVLRRCAHDETGVVLSRYHGVAGYDWIAIPLIPYLYAVKTADRIPLFADTKLVAFLREQYLPELKGIAPEGSDSSASLGPWYELLGSAYDRTLYGFQISTRPEQDDELIGKLNSSRNHESYNLLRRNCADFVRKIINFYYPKAVHRSVIGDLGVTTPKQAAKSLVEYSKHHKELGLTSFVIPQVPGLKRSKRVHGILESVLFAKKYMTAVLVLHPVVAGSVEVAYWTGWHFDPALHAAVFDPGRGLELPISNAERHRYHVLVEGLKRALQPEGFENTAAWSQLETRAEPELDSSGHPMLQVEVFGKNVKIGICRANALRIPAPLEFTEQLLLTRLDQELKPGTPSRASQREVEDDWELLQESLSRQVMQLAQKDQP